MRVYKKYVNYKIYDIENKDISSEYFLIDHKFNSNLEQQIAQFIFHSNSIIPRTKQYTDIYKINLEYFPLEHFKESINFKLTFIDFAQTFIKDTLVDIVNYKAEII